MSMADTDDINASQQRIEAHKQQVQLRSVLRCVADEKGTVSKDQMLLAAQLAGIELPNNLPARNVSPSRRIAVDPLLRSMTPQHATSPRSQLPSSNKKAAKKVDSGSYVPPGYFDLSRLEPEVIKAWQALHDRFKQNMSLVQVAFQRADLDCSGKLSRFELHGVLLSFRVPGVNHQTISKLIDVADKDGDGEINAKEFLRFIKNGVPDAQVIREHQDRFSEAKAKELLTCKNLIANRIETNFGRTGLTHAFRSIDEDKSGKLERFEIKNFLHNSNLVPEMVSAANLDLLLSAADGDGDGQINYAEFCRFIWSNDVNAMDKDVRDNYS